MAAGTPPLPLGLDPLIAEAKRRARRRRALLLALPVAVGVMAVYFDLRGPGGAPIGATSSGVSARSPVVFEGGSFSAYSGFMGDSGAGSRGTTLGCFDRRHYTEGFGLRNRSHAPLTVLGAKWRSPAPGIVRLAATQFRLSPYEPGVVGLVNRNWSAVPTRSVTVPPGRLITVQTDFVFRHCGQLAGGRTVTVPGSLTIRYRANGVVGERVIAVPADAFVLGAGPTRRTCAMGLVSTNTPCAAAEQAALACHRLSEVTNGYCKAAGMSWSCDRVVFHRGAPYVLTCDGDNSQGSDTRPRGFRVRWNAFSQRT